MIEGVSNAVLKSSSPFVKRKSEYFIQSETSKDIFETQEKKRSEKGKKVGIIIAAVSLAAAAGVFAFTKGVPKGTYKQLQKWVEKLEKSINFKELKGEDSSVLKFYNYILEKMKAFAEKSQSINNVTSIKDLMFKNIMGVTKPTRKIHNGITVLFEKFARNTVNRAYSKADKRFNKLFKSLAKPPANPNKMIEINGVSSSSGEWYKLMQKKLALAESRLTGGFGENARLSRYKMMKDADIHLEQKVADKCLNGVKNPKNIKENIRLLKESPVSREFVAEDILANDKAAIIDSVMEHRNSLDFKEILDICKAIYPAKEFGKINSKVTKSLKTLDNAINTETNLFFDKLRDLSIGSAPTDVLTVLASVGGVGVGLTKADNKDERISAMLKYGIPVVGSVGVSLLMTVGLISGFKALAGGLVSGFVINRVGEITDKYRLRKQKEIKDLKNTESIKAEINAKKA